MVAPRQIRAMILVAFSLAVSCSVAPASPGEDSLVAGPQVPISSPSADSESAGAPEVPKIAKEVLAAIKGDDGPAFLGLVPTEAMKGCVEVDGKPFKYVALAVIHDATEILSLLSAFGADLEGKCADKTPLMYAIQYGRLEMLPNLLLSRSDHQAGMGPDKDGFIEYARKYKQPEIERALLAFGAQPVGPDPKTVNDGPYVYLGDDGLAKVHWIEAGEFESQHFEKDEPIRVPRFRHLLGEELDRAAPTPAPAVWDQPEKMLVISDVEGQYKDVLRFLEANRVVDSEGKWAFGKGHLVCLGDFVDRGSEVTEVLWLFHRLSLEAKATGGWVHFILGNHEAMVLGGDIRYAHDKYRTSAGLMGKLYQDLFGAETVLGRWLRSCNSVERIGELLFVHAGLSSAVVSEKLDFQTLNDQIRSGLGVPKRELKGKPAGDLIWGRRGPLWYRGYFEQHAEKYGPVPTIEDLDKILAHAGARTIVIGHTKVPQVTSMFGGRILAIDIPWTQPTKVRGLRIESDKVELVNIKGERKAFSIGR